MQPKQYTSILTQNENAIIPGWTIISSFASLYTTILHIHTVTSTSRIPSPCNSTIEQFAAINHHMCHPIILIHLAVPHRTHLPSARIHFFSPNHPRPRSSRNSKTNYRPSDHPSPAPAHHRFIRNHNCTSR